MKIKLQSLHADTNKILKLKIHLGMLGLLAIFISLLGFSEVHVWIWRLNT